MRADPDIASTAALLSDPRRAEILLALMDGSSRPAGELARIAGVTAQTASSHLGKLLDGGLLTQNSDGRHRYYSLASRRVARVVEALSLVSRPRTAVTSTAEAEARGLRFARTCYDHLAGQLGVAWTECLVVRGHLRRTSGGFVVTRAGRTWLGELGIAPESLDHPRRAIARPCLDWSERRPHLAGTMAAALLRYVTEERLVVRVRGSRAVRLSDRGRHLFTRWGVVLPA